MDIAVVAVPTWESPNQRERRRFSNRGIEINRSVLAYQVDDEGKGLIERLLSHEAMDMQGSTGQCIAVKEEFGLTHIQLCHRATSSAFGEDFLSRFPRRVAGP